MLEVEVKVRLDDADGLRARLAKLGGRQRPSQQHVDAYFLHPARDFLITDEALRVRTVDGKHEITYKGPRQDAAAKIRSEINLAAGEDPTPLLLALGFTNSAVVEKQREEWVLDEANVCLDTLAFGTFAEVEVLADDPAATAQVESALKRLGLQDAPRLTQSYVELAQN